MINIKTIIRKIDGRTRVEIERDGKVVFLEKEELLKEAETNEYLNMALKILK